MCREALTSLINKDCEHAGLLIDRGFKEDKGNEKRNPDKMQLFADARDIAIPETYQTAFKHWQQTQKQNTEYSQTWIGKLQGRMYLGIGEASPLESGITLHHTYGVPFIPGSAIKGVISHYLDELDMDEGERTQVKSTLFGTEASTGNKQDSGSAGYVIFNDAWWVPEGKALAPEMVTVHAVEYYKNKGKTDLHPDFESPNPNPQISIQGDFFFSIEGAPELAEYAIALLKRAMQEKGIGGKTSSGYGYFYDEEEQLAKAIEDKKQEQLAKATLREGVYLKLNTRNGSFFIERGRERNIAMATTPENKEAITQSLKEDQLKNLKQGKGVKIDALINNKDLIGIKRII